MYIFRKEFKGNFTQAGTHAFIFMHILTQTKAYARMHIYTHTKTQEAIHCINNNSIILGSKSNIKGCF